MRSFEESTLFSSSAKAIGIGKKNTNWTAVIDRVFGFDDVKAAYQHMASGAHFGKIVIRVG